MSTNLNDEKEFEVFTKELERQINTPKIRHLAEESGFAQRDTKFKPEHFFQLCSFAGVSIGTKTLAGLCTKLSSLFNLSLSTEGLNQRFNTQATEFLQKIFQSLLMQHLSDPNSIIEDRLFNRIRILDSTAFNLPADYEAYDGTSGTGVKIQLEYELYEGIFRHIQIQNGKENDSTYAKTIKGDIEPGDLCLRDLGYFSQRNLLDIKENGGYFISRIRNDTYLYQQNEKGKWEKIDVLKLVEPLSLGETIELPEVRIGMESKEPLMSRVVVAKLTAEQKEKRREQLNAKKRKGKHTLAAQKNISVTTLATNVPQEMVEKEEIYPLY